MIGICEVGDTIDQKTSRKDGNAVAVGARGYIIMYYIAIWYLYSETPWERKRGLHANLWRYAFG